MWDPIEGFGGVVLAKNEVMSSLVLAGWLAGGMALEEPVTACMETCTQPLSLYTARLLHSKAVCVCLLSVCD